MVHASSVYAPRIPGLNVETWGTRTRVSLTMKVPYRGSFFFPAIFTVVDTPLASGPGWLRPTNSV